MFESLIRGSGRPRTSVLPVGITKRSFLRRFHREGKSELHSFFSDSSIHMALQTLRVRSELRSVVMMVWVSSDQHQEHDQRGAEIH